MLYPALALEYHLSRSLDTAGESVRAKSDSSEASRSAAAPSPLPVAYVPGPPLAAFVEMLWTYECYAPAHPRERLLPTGTVELVIDLGDRPATLYDGTTDRRLTFRGPLICGPHSQSFVIDTAHASTVVGVHFKPGGAHPFLGPPADELHNQHVPLDALWGASAGQLRERMLEASTAAARFHILEAALMARAARPLSRHPAVSFGIERFLAAPHARVSEVIGRIGLSPRRFIQVFTEEVGLTPKLFCRIQRFQDALRRVETGQPFGWADVAQACGYYDQAHFIHDFRSFSGLSPSEYAKERGDHFNHLPLPEISRRQDSSTTDPRAAPILTAERGPIPARSIDRPRAPNHGGTPDACQTDPRRLPHGDALLDHQGRGPSHRLLQEGVRGRGADAIHRSQ